ncbi:MAG: hypothetical protein JWM72_3479 [Actinomycetia bacterium]|jgi:hypothetical protein|nr:hypothetical protein [Actinomycetes bacterium]MDQ1461370.1 hypothetical protein [Actinomycetota bacterium]
MPITLVDRARAQLRSFFSEGPWTVEDDGGLSGLVGPGTGWTEEELAPGIRLSYGWRSSTFRVDVAAEPVADTSAVGAPGTAPVDRPRPDELDVPEPTSPPQHRTLGDTFEELVLVEAVRDPAEVRFVTGPGVSGRAGRFTRDDQGSSAAVAALFREFGDIEVVRVEMGSVTIALADPDRWPELLLDVFDAVTSVFVPPRVAHTDRQHERAVAEIGSLDVSNPRDLARLLDATSSPDAAFRALAVARLELVDPALVVKPWTRALDDSSRAVRRAALRAMSHAARPDLRLLYERALSDKDACVRYYALRGLAHIGVGRAEQTVDRHHNDDDLRVRYAARAALAGRIPR